MRQERDHGRSSTTTGLAAPRPAGPSGPLVATCQPSSDDRRHPGRRRRPESGGPLQTGRGQPDDRGNHDHHGAGRRQDGRRGRARTRPRPRRRRCRPQPRARHDEGAQQPTDRAAADCRDAASRTRKANRSARRAPAADSRATSAATSSRTMRAKKTAKASRTAIPNEPMSSSRPRPASARASSVAIVPVGLDIEKALSCADRPAPTPGHRST